MLEAAVNSLQLNYHQTHDLIKSSIQLTLVDFYRYKETECLNVYLI